MEPGFYCPFCKAKISDEETASIRFYGFVHGEHFKVGSYYRLPSKICAYGGTPENGSLELQDGAVVEFCCPQEECCRSFTAPYNQDLAQILWVDEHGEKKSVAFNRTLGKHMTFVIDPEKRQLSASVGEDREELEKAWVEYLRGPHCW